ncbi:RagB/SusD family nutrient uptake outer membrane protein [Niabella terrae]
MTSCKKFLEAKPDYKLTIPENIGDLQALLDNEANNRIGSSVSELAADNYYLLPSVFDAYHNEYDKRLYTWEHERVVTPGAGSPWLSYYSLINIANTVLEGLKSVSRTSGDTELFNAAKGGALFLRGFTYSNLAFIWTLAYDKQTADTDLGLPLRLDANFNTPSVRASNEETYQSILFDLKESALLLPNLPSHPMKPSKAAAYGMLARVYLSMRQYDSCYKYASLAFNLKSDLLDFNTDITISSRYPFARFNKEVIYDEYALGGTMITSTSRGIVDSTLFSSYHTDDLRLNAYFTNTTGASAGYKAFKGTYSGSNTCFSGIATDELYLMLAECLARSGEFSKAVEKLNTLLEKRFATGKFEVISPTSENDLLSIILKERRKELVLRCLRWMEIKRLNKEGYNITLQRKINDQIYTLAPNDLRYAIALPEDVISIAGLEQNPR